MDELDRIPWANLSHAYGSAEDVPQLLRALRNGPASGYGEGTPLWELYGNIWHQGTVYEATPHAVPFLIKLVADPATPNRIGILNLLADIAQGDSREWAAKAHRAVATGFTEFARIANDNSDAAMAAAHVLAQLQEHANEVGEMLRRLLIDEKRPVFRAGLILLGGQSSDRSEAMIAVLAEAVESSESSERFAASIAICRLKPNVLPTVAIPAIKEAILTDKFEEPFYDLPWDAVGDAARDRPLLWESLEKRDSQSVAESLISVIENGQGTDVRVTTLIDILFPRASNGLAHNWKPSEMADLQKQAICSLAQALQGEKRIFYGHFPCWGLPDTLQEWKTLAVDCR